MITPPMSVVVEHKLDTEKIAPKSIGTCACFPYVISTSYAAIFNMFRAKISALGLLNRATVTKFRRTVLSRSKLQFCIEFFQQYGRKTFGSNKGTCSAVRGEWPPRTPPRQSSSCRAPRAWWTLAPPADTSVSQNRQISFPRRFYIEKVCCGGELKRL